MIKSIGTGLRPPPPGVGRPWRKSGCASRPLRQPSGGGVEPAYTYGRATEVVVYRPGEGVWYGSSTPVGGGNDGGGSDQMSTVPVSVVRIFWRRVGANYEEVKGREDKHK